MKTALTFLTSISTLAIVAASAAPAWAQASDDLVKAAKQEGELSVIALPHDWCGYGGMIDGFKAKYGLKMNELNPDAGSGDEVEAIRANKGNKGPQAPDVIDVGLSFGPTAKAEGLLLPYRVSTWATIPADQKDADGAWYGDYYGVLTFEVNKDIVKTSPADWTDLLGGDYANTVALAGDPRTSNQAILAVYAAGLSKADGDAGKAAQAGLDFFAAMNKKGNLVPTIGKVASLAQGATPIVVRWDYNALADRDTLKGNPNVDVVVPKTGVVAGVYVQAISAFAPPPQRRQALDGLPLFGRGSGQLPQGLLPPDPLRRPGQGRQGAGRRDEQAAAGRSLCPCGLPDHRAAERLQDHDHDRVGQDGRRQREVTLPRG